MMAGETQRWVPLLPVVQLAYNNKVSARHGCTPFSLMFTRKLNAFMNYTHVELTDVEVDELKRRISSAVDLVYPAVEERTKSYNAKMKSLFDRSKNVSVQFPSGSYVMVSNVTRRSKWEPEWEGPYVVIRRKMAGSYRLRCPASGKDIGAPVPPERLKAIKVGPVTGTTLEVDQIVEHITDEHGDVSVPGSLERARP